MRTVAGIKRGHVPNPLKLVIFDCDGTLVDSQHMILAAMHASYGAHGLPVPPRETLLSVVGLSLPEAFGKWFTVYTRFWRWARKGVWERVFKALCEDPDFEYVLIDGTLVRVHQHGTGAKGGLKIRPLAARVAA